jgi:hypothetical protein
MAHSLFSGRLLLLGFWFLPTWLMAPLFFLTRVWAATAGACGPSGHAPQPRHLERPRAQAGPALRRLLISCAILLVPVALFDIYSFSFLTYVTLLAVVIVLPFHLVCRRHVRCRPLRALQGRGKATLVFPLRASGHRGLSGGHRLELRPLPIRPPVPRGFSQGLRRLRICSAPAGKPLDRMGKRTSTRRWATSLGAFTSRRGDRR